MKNKKQNLAINQAWQKAREEEDPKMVLSLVKNKKAQTRSKHNKKYLASATYNEDWRGKSKSCKNRVSGERKIERHLLNEKYLSFLWEKGQAKITTVRNAVQIGAKNNERRQVDLLGLDQSNSPVAIEIKVTDQNPWYATVELCEYICRLRRDRSKLEGEFMHHFGGKRYRGVWGILLAPLKWYLKDTEKFKKHCELIEVLQKRTKVRICSLAWIGSVPKNPILVAGHPPIKSYKTA